MRNIVFCFSLITLFSLNVYGQKFLGYSDFMYLLQQPNARAEAMGRGQVTMYGDPFSAFYNPASTSFGKGLSAEYTYSQPHFFEPDMNFMNFKHHGISYNFGKYGAAALNYILIDNYEEVTTVDARPAGIDYPDNNAITALLTLNYSYPLFDDFSLGININYYEDEYYFHNVTCMPVDIGALKRISIPGRLVDQNVTGGLSASNIFNAKVEQSNFKRYLPSILRAGISYELKLNEYAGKMRILNLLVSAQYRRLLNSDYYDGGQYGSELTLLDLLKLRAGYYTMRLERFRFDIFDVGPVNLERFTYGFGLNIDPEKFFSVNIPIDLQFDFARLPAPDASEPSRSGSMYSVYSLTLNYSF